jgi:hypothetical protein
LIGPDYEPVSKKELLGVAEILWWLLEAMLEVIW